MPQVRVNELSIDTAPNVPVEALARIIKNIEPRTIFIDGCSFGKSSLLAELENLQNIHTCSLRPWSAETTAWYSYNPQQTHYINVYSINEKASIYLIEPRPVAREYNHPEGNEVRRPLIDCRIVKEKPW
jgi:hypothetical protein